MFKNRNLTRISLLVLGLLLVLGSAMYVVPRVMAGSCFTDVNASDWFEPYVCWLKTKGITSGYPDGTYKPNNGISRAEMAVMLRSAFTNPGMVTFINTGPSAWIVNSIYSPPAYVEHDWSYSRLRSTAIGTYLYSMSPSLPSSLYNTLNYIMGVKLCVDAVDYPSAYLTGVDIYHVAYNSSGFHVVNAVVSTSDLNATGCYAYNFTTPGAFWGNDQLTVNVWGQINNPNSSARVSLVTIIIQPSMQIAILEGEDDLLNSLRLVEPFGSVQDPTSGE